MFLVLMRVDDQSDKPNNGHRHKHLDLVPTSAPQIIRHNWKWTILNCLMKECIDAGLIFVIRQLEI